MRLAYLIHTLRATRTKRRLVECKAAEGTCLRSEAVRNDIGRHGHAEAVLVLSHVGLNAHKELSAALGVKHWRDVQKIPKNRPC